MSNVSENGEFIRIVGGRVLSNTVVRTPVIRIESFRRDVSKQVQWHFKQPELALFFYRRGARKLRGKMDGKSFDQQLAGNLAVYPAGLEIDGEFTVTSAKSDYTVVFFDQTFISERLPSLRQRRDWGSITPQSPSDWKNCAASRIMTTMSMR